MPKKNNSSSIYSVSENLYKKQDKEGAGAGSGVEYKSGLDVIRVPSSKGNKKHKIPGIKSGRLIQLMSNLERDTFLFFDLSKNVKDIREQFPLDRSITLAIAEKLGIGHPKGIDAHTGLPMAIRMTTDLLIDYVDEDKKGNYSALSKGILQ
ncbi:TnsA endonuclease N-terminal domain-containing protein [Endozoicomonas sp. SCSIO W0465]|uniref:TnsA endonuclease N-terminal domain-containing protein n=1 Tax=Endozoicomonas sp. SCSIO W0465 TaxID=2918516 RepID=UPI0020763FD4|nr:TnsA endonuclease N-terminal domain-containing protein [Endozoicomonas sp. SCSIO W0465]USE34989.1 TnsA endonuclease N-terminal domain-containing protein [Endozoicomonas sp. SCSIO W0465]